MYKLALLVILVFVCICSFAQTYTSTGETGNSWTLGSNWGGTAPTFPFYGNTINVNNNLNYTGDMLFGGSSFNVASTETLTVTGNFTNSGYGTSNINGNINVAGNITISGGTTNIYGTVSTTTSTGSLTISGGTVNVYGTLYIMGDVTLTSYLNIFPGGQVIIDGNLTITSSNYLTVGTDVAPGYYADLIIKKNLYLSGGKMTIKQNGRMAVFKNIESNTWGSSSITLSDGAEAYVGGTTTYNGGSDHLTNNNDGNPYYGFYSNNQPVYNGGGGSSNGTAGTNSVQPTSDMNTDFYNWVTSIPGNPLPITLVSFKVNIISENIVLTWSTATELNFDYFSLQKSADGKSFYEIAQVQGHGTTNVAHNYSYQDQSPLIGKNYYRLTSVDFDNYQETFKVVVQDYTGAKDFTVSPNPTDGISVTFNINFEEANGNVTIYDQLGSPIASYQVNETSTILFTNPMKSGFYLARYSSPVFSKTVRFVVK